MKSLLDALEEVHDSQPPRIGDPGHCVSIVTRTPVAGQSVRISSPQFTAMGRMDNRRLGLDHGAAERAGAFFDMQRDPVRHHGNAEEGAMPVPPNILLIAAERADTLSPYGNTVCRTPNLDRMAGAGARFADCMVTPADSSHYLADRTIELLDSVRDHGQPRRQRQLPDPHHPFTVPEPWASAYGPAAGRRPSHGGQDMPSWYDSILDSASPAAARSARTKTPPGAAACRRPGAPGSSPSMNSLLGLRRTAPSH